MTFIWPAITSPLALWAKYQVTNPNFMSDYEQESGCLSHKSLFLLSLWSSLKRVFRLALYLYADLAKHFNERFEISDIAIYLINLAIIQIRTQ